MHLDLGKRMHKCNLKVNMSKTQGHGEIKDAATCTSSYLNYTVLNIVFVLYCQCYIIQCVKSTGANLELCEKHLFIWCAVASESG